MVVALVWLFDPKSYTGDIIAPGKVFQAERSKGDDQDKKKHCARPGWG
jgi:hypothetical protein